MLWPMAYKKNNTRIYMLGTDLYRFIFYFKLFNSHNVGLLCFLFGQTCWLDKNNSVSTKRNTSNSNTDFLGLGRNTPWSWNCVVFWKQLPSLDFHANHFFRPTKSIILGHAVNNNRDVKSLNASIFDIHTQYSYS